MMLKLIKNFLFISLIILSFGCEEKSDTLPQKIPAQLELASGKVLDIKIVYLPSDTTRGLSGVLPSEFGDREGLLFFFPELGQRSFWMPDTYFNLDIIYLDAQLKVLNIQRNIPHHIGFEEPVPRARAELAQHVLEIKANSPLANDIQVGDQLKFKGDWKKLSKRILLVLGK